MQKSSDKMKSSTFVGSKTTCFIFQDEYKYLYDLMLHWYMTNPEYRRFDEEGEDSPMGGSERRTSIVKSRNTSARRSSRSPRTITDANHVL